MIGYPCLAVGYRDYSFKKVLKKNISKEQLELVIENNLESLEKIIEYNRSRDIHMFRISSDIIPFGNKYLDLLDWRKVYKNRLLEIGEKINRYKIRVSMHPGQYTVLNSKDEKVVKNAVIDLEYHTDFLDGLGVDKTNKIILHVGGVYGDKDLAMDRFIKEYNLLNQKVKDRLIIENDHVSYNIDDILYINSAVGVPLVFDNLHNEILPGKSGLKEFEIIEIFRKTWKSKDGKQKIHYSQQSKVKSKGSHSKTIDLEKFKAFYDNIVSEVDIMLEVKDKDLSAVKSKNLVENSNIKYLEIEWARYKYNILEHSPKTYEDIRKLLKNKDEYPVIDFYRLIDYALNLEIERNKFINGFEHVWGYFKDSSNIEEKTKKERYIVRYLDGKIGEKPMKKFLLDLAEKYKEKYLLESYYFNF